MLCNLKKLQSIIDELSKIKWIVYYDHIWFWDYLYYMIVKWNRVDLWKTYDKSCKTLSSKYNLKIPKEYSENEVIDFLEDKWIEVDDNNNYHITSSKWNVVVYKNNWIYHYSITSNNKLVKLWRTRTIDEEWFNDITK